MREIFQLKRLTLEELVQLLKNALHDEERGLGKYSIDIHDEQIKKLRLLPMVMLGKL